MPIKPVIAALSLLALVACAPAAPEATPTKAPTPTPTPVLYDAETAQSTIAASVYGTIAAWPQPTAQVVEVPVTVTPTPTATPTLTPTPDAQATIAASVKATVEAIHPPTPTVPPSPTTPPTVTPTPRPTTPPTPTPFHNDLRSQGLSAGMVEAIGEATGRECALPNPATVKTAWNKLDGAGNGAYSVAVPSGAAYVVFGVTAAGSDWAAKLNVKGLYNSYDQTVTATRNGGAGMLALCASDVRRGSPFGLHVTAKNANWEIYVLSEAGDYSPPSQVRDALVSPATCAARAGQPPYELSKPWSSVGVGTGDRTFTVPLVKGWTLLLVEFSPAGNRPDRGFAGVSVSGGYTYPAFAMNQTDRRRVIPACLTESATATVTYNRGYGELSVWTLTPR